MRGWTESFLKEQCPTMYSMIHFKCLATAALSHLLPKLTVTKPLAVQVDKYSSSVLLIFQVLQIPPMLLNKKKKLY